MSWQRRRRKRWIAHQILNYSNVFVGRSVVDVYSRIHCDNSLIIIFAFNRRCLQYSLIHWNLHYRTHCAQCTTPRTINSAGENLYPKKNLSDLMKPIWHLFGGIANDIVILINLAIDGGKPEKVKRYPKRKNRNQNIILWNHVRNYMCRPPNQLTPLVMASCRSRRERPQKVNSSLAIGPHHQSVHKKCICM